MVESALNGAGVGRAVDALARIQSLAAETVTEDELRGLVEKARRAAAGEGQAPHAYIGFEPSGTAHVGWMVCTDMVRRLLDSGFRVTILLADWHAQINDKLGGDLAAIQRCGTYMQEAFEALGIPRGAVTYRTASEFAADPQYWALVLQVAKHSSLARVRRAMTILGRTEDEADADLSKFLYPAMQVADIFHMGIDLAYGGLDQRHAHMLARDVAPRLGRTPPAAIHTPLVPGLQAGTGRMDPIEAKMSKSKAESGIFLHDTPEEIQAKLKAAHCPAKEVAGNPVLDLLRLVVFPRLAGPLVVRRPERFGGDASFASYADVEAAFVSGALHPMDLKAATGAAMADVLAPVRAYFERHPDNWRFVQSLRRTR
jgi:tyrosyl-tRNA synthetase